MYAISLQCLSFAFFSIKLKDNGDEIMKRKFILATIIALLLTITNVFAEEINNTTFKATGKDGNVSIVEADIMGEVDYSNLQVKVIKVVKGEESLIFEGILGEYDDGVWSKVDFDNLDFMVILDWNTMEDEAIYIVPLEKANYTNEIMTETTDYSVNDVTTAENEILSEEVTTQTDLYEEHYSSSEIFVIKDAILENENNTVNSLQNATVLSKVVLATKQTNEIAPVIFAALYNDGRLVDVKMMDATQNNSTGSVVEYTLNMPLTNTSENMTLKIMTWDGMGTIKPYAIPLNIYYGYSIDVSTVLNQEYTIPIITNTSATKFKVSYDKDFFAVKDLCRDADDIVTEIGMINNEITINEITQSSFTFTANTENKCVNCVVLRALKSGNTAIKIEEILE